jgi:adenylate cyclase class IV
MMAFITVGWVIVIAHVMDICQYVEIELENLVSHVMMALIMDTQILVIQAVVDSWCQYVEIEL